MSYDQEQELETLCNDCLQSFKLIKAPYWPPEINGFGRYIRKYGFYPSWLPLCIYTDHGVGNHEVAPHELNSSAPVQLFHSPIAVRNWKKSSDKPCYVLYSPFVFYRRKNRVERSVDIKGTIAFPAHSTPSIDDCSDSQKYIDQLKALPSQYQPVSICLHMHDIHKGLHKIFLSNGFDVYTAGNTSDDRFVERFYNIIKKFKYATSNMVGSYAFYCIEMGIPFFVYGARQKYYNKSDPNVRSGEWDPYNDVESYRNRVNLFSDMTTEISDSQKNIVTRDLGLNAGISRFGMFVILYGSLAKWLLNINNISHVFRDLKSRLALRYKRLFDR